MPRSNFPTAAAFLPSTLDYEHARLSAQKCRGCDLFASAHQTVFGEGALNHPVMFVGEQPGDQEDRQGHPFVGPAGKLFDQLLAQAGFQREQVYITNAVKHFYFELIHARRIHKKPKTSHVQACKPWLALEIQMVEPRVLVCLGATAAQSVLGKPVKIGEERGKLIASPGCAHTLITLHPSALLRIPDPDLKARQTALFLEDLKCAKEQFERLNA